MIGGLARRVASSLVRRRDRLPRWLDSAIDRASKNPDGLLGRLASLVLGSGQGAVAPSPELSDPIRVLIGPTNYAGQGHAWARALEAHAGVGARNFAVDLPGGFAFSADSLVPLAVYNRSRRWQEAQFDAASSYTHVLVEAERPLFGSLFGRDVGREVAALTEEGVSVAFLSHGTDIRSPRRHRGLTIWSPFRDGHERDVALQEDADRNAELLMHTGRPVFISTPDLFDDLPEAIWCPVAVDLARWEPRRPLVTDRRVVVAHAPSMDHVKGSALIDGQVDEMSRSGLIEYRRIQGVPSAEMPSVVGDADIVLDQFRLGSYGVAACEAMAAGRVVVGHVRDDVRDHILRLTGRELPVVEATPSTIVDVLSDLARDPDRMHELGSLGSDYVSEVHDGRMSSAALLENWIRSGR